MKVGNRPSKRTRHGFTVTADQLMEEAARREMGARIRQLREQSPWKQQHMANKVGVGLRMWQRIEQRGTTEWERVEQIAEIHDTDPHWIWSGEEKKPTPNVLRSLNGSSQEQLDRIEANLIRLLVAAGLEPAGRSQEVAARLSEEADDVLPKGDERGQTKPAEQESGRAGR